MRKLAILLALGIVITEETFSAPKTSVYEGTYELTAYTWTGNPMSNGEYPYEGAVASNKIPIGTVINIEGYGQFVVKDTGGMSNNVIDIYMDTYDECIQFGRQTAYVTVVEGE